MAAEKIPREDAPTCGRCIDLARPPARMGTRVWRHAVLAGLVACSSVLVAGLSGCASLSASTVAYAGAPHPPPTDPAGIEILRQVPSRAHERLGEVVVDASTNPAPPIGDVEAKLRNEAAALGADAVVVVLDRIQPISAYVSGPYWGRSVETLTGRKLVGVAIKYR